ncbi:MAG: hypothetical protein AB1782_09195 [Cyanobacteriota bacterium]
MNLIRGKRGRRRGNGIFSNVGEGIFDSFSSGCGGCGGCGG